MIAPKIIWITGGSSGIGFATAKHYLNNKWIVVISSSNSEKLQKAKDRLKNENNFENYKDKFFKEFNEYPSHLSLLSYDLVGFMCLESGQTLNT